MDAAIIRSVLRHPHVLRTLVDACTLEDIAYETLGPIAVENRFVCQDAVDAKRLLVITRKELLREAEELYAGNAICDELWHIRIFMRRKGSLYNVYVSNEYLLTQLVPGFDSLRFTTRGWPSKRTSNPNLASRPRLKELKGSL